MTRGSGFLEGYLEKERIKLARKLIKDISSNDNILDIGCGMHPNFLLGVDFKNKFGIDRIIESDKTQTSNIKLVNYDLAANKKMPFGDNYFDVVSLLAVIEHMSLKDIKFIFSEVNRVLKSGGKLIITTPSYISKWVLESMAVVNLVSKEELEEHQTYFSKLRLRKVLQTEFKNSDIRIGRFEFFLNLFACITK
jgi:ubiquinone/menaquinone biosynthesis C-methylase UbiE